MKFNIIKRITELLQRVKERFAGTSCFAAVRKLDFFFVIPGLNAGKRGTTLY
jgi:hypothetical protein